jgi:Domain of unknown function (DUF1843)
MPARKTTKKSGTKKAGKARAGAKVETGPVAPYGDPIRKAVARGDLQEMKATAASARKWVSDVQAALKELDSAIKKSQTK